MRVGMKGFLTFSAALFIVTSLYAQQQSDLRYNMIFPDFGVTGEHLYVEVYYSFDVSVLKYVKKNNELQSESIVSVTFKRSSDDSIVARQAWKIPFSVSDTMMLKTSRSYSDIFAFYLKPDIYRAYIVASDGNAPTVKDSISIVVDLKPFTSETIALSDVELCSSIQQIDRDSTNRFYKNTFEVKPNPTKMFGLHQPVLFYYLETY